MLLNFASLPKKLSMQRLAFKFYGVGAEGREKVCDFCSALKYCTCARAVLVKENNYSLTRFLR